ncbi:UNVERIFIED_CONTAM: zinc finger protein [Trichonephila clavipes]
MRQKIYMILIKGLNRWFSLKKYKEHFLTVHKEVNFNACHICSKQFTKTSLVKRHLIIHSKEKEFKCDTCYKTFSTNYNETACRETCQ